MIRRDEHAMVRGGFTLMEMLVVVAIIVVLAGVAVPLYMGRLEEAKRDTARAQIETLTRTCQTYKLRYGDFPATLEVLCQPQLDGASAYIEPSALLDPWAREYQYDPLAQQSGINATYQKPDIWSLGPNPGDPAGIIGNWQNTLGHLAGR